MPQSHASPAPMSQPLPGKEQSPDVLLPPLRSHYSTTAAQQILSQAAQNHSDVPFTWEHIVAMGVELGLSPDTLATAEQQWQKEQQCPHYQQTQRHQWRRQFRQYLCVNALLVTINLLVCGTLTWAIWPIIGWGAGLVIPRVNSSICRCPSRLTT